MFMENQITIQKDNVLRAYSQATVEQKVLLENIFGKDMFQPKDIKERVKTLEDAILELGYNNQKVIDYYAIAYDTTAKDILAYAKLRVIAKALNEGWQPQFIEDEKRWYPWFSLWTKNELKDKSEQWKTENKLWLFGGSSSLGSSCGLACSSSDAAWASSSASSSARLAVKSKELAEYFGEQFIDIWADFLFA